MAQIRFIFIFAAAAVVSINGQGDPASYAPIFWCDDADLAKLVGVDKQCDAYARAVYNKKVTLTLLYESLCCGCRSVITGVYPLLFPTLKDYVNFEFVPYGRVTQNGTQFICDHGELECQLNIIESCALHFVDELEKRFDYVVCVEDRADDLTPEEILTTCAQNASISDSEKKLIGDCWNSDVGAKLFEAMGNRTHSAWPQKAHWAPWIFINNASTRASQKLIGHGRAKDVVILKHQLCASYRGDHIPPPCQDGQLDNFV